MSNVFLIMLTENDLIKFCIVLAICLVTFDLVYSQIVNAMYEDEFEICSFEKECFTIPADDIFDDETIEKIWMRFQYDLDTYSR